MARLDTYDEELVAAVKELVPDPANPPPQFDIKKLTPLSLEKTMWWDEHHKQVKIGIGVPNTDKQTLFPWDEDGNIDLENGKYNDALKELNVKYPEEVRFCLVAFGMARRDMYLISWNIPVKQLCLLRIMTST